VTDNHELLVVPSATAVGDKVACNRSQDDWRDGDYCAVVRPAIGQPRDHYLLVGCCMRGFPRFRESSAYESSGEESVKDIVLC
jgi:hypothetical protein